MGCKPSQPANTHAPNTSFSRTDLTEDINFLDEQLRKNHPGLFWHTSENELKHIKDQLTQTLPKKMTEADFLKHLAIYNNYIRCVHSDIRPSAHYQQLIDSLPGYIPFNVTMSGGRYFVYQNLTPHVSLSRYPEIISINGQPIDAIMDGILPRIPADGKNKTYKYNALKRQFTKYLSLYQSPYETVFDVVVRTGKGEIKSFLLRGITRETFLARRDKLFPADNRPVSFSFQDSIGVLKIKSFRHDLMDAYGINFHTYLSDVFSRLKDRNTQKLIVDLRNNGGGYSEYGAQLLSFLSDTAFRYTNRLIVNSDTLSSLVSYNIPETFAGYPAGIVKEGEYWVWPKHSTLHEYQPEPNRFGGQVYFLINGGGASTTSEVTSIAHHLKLGEFIGEEIGGSYEGDSGGVLGWITLPNTGIWVRMALVKYELAVGEAFNEHGVIPEHRISPSIDDIRSGTDTVMGYALQRFGSSK